MTDEQFNALRDIVCFGHWCDECQLGMERCGRRDVEDAELIRMARSNFANADATTKKAIIACANRHGIYSLIVKAVVL